jgi:hypothetical protein
MDNNAIQNIISSMQALVLLDTEDLSVYRDKLENYNLQLSWVNQDMSSSFLVHLAQTQLSKSRYKHDIEALQISHTASGTSFTSLADLCDGLERLDKLKGLPYGGAAPIQKPTPSKTPIPSKKPHTVGFVTAAADTSSLTPDTEFEFHNESWVGAINLLETYVKQLRSMFKCIQCHSNDHTLPSCPFMKSWIIKKKPRSENTPNQTPQAKSVGGVNSVLAPKVDESEIPDDNNQVTEDLIEAIDNHNGPVEFDLLDSLAITTINDQVSPYIALKHPLGAVRSVSSSQITNSSDTQNDTLKYNLIVDSGCTKHMFPYKELFISYKETPSSFVVLADKSKVPCFGSGTVRLFLQSKAIIIHDVLHVPKLCSPLLSVRCFRRLTGCSFIADNKGSFLTFPTFILPVDDSSDCTIIGRACSSTKVDFDSRITGSVAAVSDNTRFKHQRRPILPKTSNNNQQTDKINLFSEDSFSLPDTTSQTQDTSIESTLKH